MKNWKQSHSQKRRCYLLPSKQSNKHTCFSASAASVSASSLRSHLVGTLWWWWWCWYFFGVYISEPETKCKRYVVYVFILTRVFIQIYFGVLFNEVWRVVVVSMTRGSSSEDLKKIKNDDNKMQTRDQNLLLPCGNLSRSHRFSRRDRVCTRLQLFVVCLGVGFVPTYPDL